MFTHVYKDMLQDENMFNKYTYLVLTFLMLKPIVNVKQMFVFIILKYIIFCFVFLAKLLLIRYIFSSSCFVITYLLLEPDIWEPDHNVHGT